MVKISEEPLPVGLVTTSNSIGN